ncbi:hypothetical protein LPJ66_000855 [Kickxella alabastrina]|uniref:Uncharacterized protein n=1 Tax=Kickxella alabastrina TaxID=61397 RepID=A0ACC1IUU3_9FUNG|nr:hypothetical protein LPJ66_000855 [Kickxella alabastrina]
MSSSNEEVNKIELYAVEGVVKTNNSDDIVELDCDDTKSSSDIELLRMVVSKLSVAGKLKMGVVEDDSKVVVDKNGVSEVGASEIDGLEELDKMSDEDNEEVMISNKDSVIEPIAGTGKKGKYVDTTVRLGVVFSMGVDNESRPDFDSEAVDSVITGKGLELSAVAVLSKDVSSV